MILGLVVTGFSPLGNGASYWREVEFQHFSNLKGFTGYWFDRISGHFFVGYLVSGRIFGWIVNIEFSSKNLKYQKNLLTSLIAILLSFSTYWKVLLKFCLSVFSFKKGQISGATLIKFFIFIVILTDNRITSYDIYYEGLSWKTCKQRNRVRLTGSGLDTQEKPGFVSDKIRVTHFVLSILIVKRMLKRYK